MSFQNAVKFSRCYAQVPALVWWPNLVHWRQIMKRRDFLKQAGIGSATVVSLPALAQALAGPASTSSPLDTGGGLGNKFSVLLSGLYQPVAKCPDFGLSTVNVCDGSYSTTKIYPISGLPAGESDQFNHGNRRDDFRCETANAIGDFYVAI